MAEEPLVRDMVTLLSLDLRQGLCLPSSGLDIRLLLPPPGPSQRGQEGSTNRVSNHYGIPEMAGEVASGKSPCQGPELITLKKGLGGAWYSGTRLESQC